MRPTTPTHFPNADPEAQESHDRIGTSDHNKPSIVVSSCDRQITSRRSRPLLHAVRRRASKKQRQIAGNLTLRPSWRPCRGSGRSSPGGSSREGPIARPRSWIESRGSARSDWRRSGRWSEWNDVPETARGRTRKALQRLPGCGGQEDRVASQDVVMSWRPRSGRGQLGSAPRLRRSAGPASAARRRSPTCL